jgi:ketosteroid isomerase-like protein
MRRHLGPLPRLILAVLATATLTVAQAAEAQDTDEDAIKNVLIDMWDAIEHGDVDRYAAHVHPDFTSFGENDPYLNEGKEYEVQSVAGWIARSPGVHTEMHQPEITVRGNTAWITYYWTDGWTNPDGTRGGSAGKSTRIFVKENGRWLCIHGHYTNRPE